MKTKKYVYMWGYSYCWQGSMCAFFFESKALAEAKQKADAWFVGRWTSPVHKKRFLAPTIMGGRK